MNKLTKFLSLPNKEKKEKIKRYLNHKINIWNIQKRYIPNGYKKSNNFVISNPKVSILMPIYNHADVAIKAIDSVLSQTYDNFELIILDDGSKDQLLKILKPYNKLKNIKIYTQKNQKLPRALTHLHQLADGDFITWTSADNIMHPKMIEELLKKLLKEPEAALVYGDVSLINAKEKPYYGPCRDKERDIKKPRIIRLSRSEKPLSIGTDNYINASFLYRTENSSVLMGKYEDDIIGAEDYDFWLRLSKTGKLKHIKNNKPYYYYRVHDNSMSHELETKKIKEHQSRLECLKNYEQERIKWCEKRSKIFLNKDLNAKNLKKLISSLNLLPVDIIEKSQKNNNDEIIFCEKNCNKDVYIKVNEEYYILYNNKLSKEIVKIYKGLNIPRETYRARNNLSHPYYQDDLALIKKPIFGCHINSKKICIEEITRIIANNPTLYFVIIDEITNEELKKLCQNYNNLIYYENKTFGYEYETYSYFSRIVAFDNSDITNNYKNILLGYACGRMINYFNNKFYTLFPYTITSAENIYFSSSDAINDEDYEIMDKYLNNYNEENSLKRIINYYKAHTQEMYIERPKYDIESIPEESEPVLIEKECEEK